MRKKEEKKEKKQKKKKENHKKLNVWLGWGLGGGGAEGCVNRQEEDCL